MDHEHEHEHDRWVAETTEEHLPALQRYVRSLVRDPDEAADICQDVAVRLLVAARSGARPDAPGPWMYRVAHNLVVSRARHRSVATRAAEHLVDRRGVAGVDVEILEREQHVRVRETLAAAPADDRIAILMAAYGRSGREIAARLGRSDEATRSLLCRARARIRTQLVAADAI
jgi:RNA polymerase sigma-70 factor (ECF subfamily)